MDIREHVSLAEHTTFRLGGPARFFVTVTNVPDLRDALDFARSKGLPIAVLAGGSNIVFADEGYLGLVIHIAIMGREYEEHSEGDARLIASAGEPWDALVAETVNHGLWGFENLSSIPGTTGAVPVQNVGAYGVEVEETIDWVEALDQRTGELVLFSKSECAFGYRDSFFKTEAGRHFIITRTSFRLHTKPHPKLTYRDLVVELDNREDVEVSEVRDAVVRIRARKFPDMRVVGTAGSCFKNPVISKAQYLTLRNVFGEDAPTYPAHDGKVKVPLAWILDKMGMKGVKQGAIGTWDTQPLVLVHYGGGTTHELVSFAEGIVRDVHRATGIKIEPEVRVVEHTT